MRKILTLIFALFFLALNAQFQGLHIPENLRSKAVRVRDRIQPEQVNSNASYARDQKVLEDMVGTTYYDLQSYFSLENRMIAFDDGTIGLVWIMANDTANWSDWGTGYNFFDGSAWGQPPSTRIEATRTRWPCYAPYGDNGEIVVSSTTNILTGLIFSKRETKGQGDWETFNLPGPSGYWLFNPAMITNGPDNKIIHILALTDGNPYQGMNGALLYYRSQDGGLTWDIEHQLLDGINSDVFNGIDRNAYAWAPPRGDTLAFSIGFCYANGYVMKSFDNGNTWQRITVYENPYSPYTGGATPEFGGGDDTQSLVIDSKGKVHVVFGRMRYFFDDQNQLFYFPFTEGLIYWNESMPVLDTTAVSSYTVDNLFNGGNLLGYLIPYQGDSTILDIGNYQTSLTSHPQIAIDEYDNIFVFWSGLAAGFDDAEKTYRHIYGRASNDLGATWTPISDFSVELGYELKEGAYPVISPTFPDGKVHFAFQADDKPGVHYWSNDHEAIQNEIIYANASVSEFLGIIEPATEQKPNLAITYYPNPFDLVLTLDIQVLNQGNLSVRLADMNGRSVFYKEYGRVPTGQRQIHIPGVDFKPGIYIYTVSLDNQAISGKVVRK